jgi:elongation factor G
VRPLERGAGFEFVDSIVGGAIPRQFIPAVEKGVIETMQLGGVFGFPVGDVLVECFDGKYHSVDSSEMSFKMAGSLGFKEAMAKANPILLEPISELVVTAPEQYQGDLMGDLNSKRGRIMGSSAVGNGEMEIVAHVPTSEVLQYSNNLRSITGGRGRFELHHARYDPVPSHLVDRMAKQNLLKRVRSTRDRRQNSLELTPHGAARLRAMLRYVNAHERRITARLSAPECKQLIDLLRKIG